MKMHIAAIATAALVLTGSAASAQPVSAPPPGTPAACAAQWDNLVATHATGDQSRHHYMRECVTKGEGPPREDHTWAYVAGAGLIAVVAVAAATTGSKPTSP